MDQKRSTGFMVSKYVSLNEGFYEGSRVYVKG
jgi:hypothetical protein